MPLTDFPAPSRVAAPEPEEEIETSSDFSTRIKQGAEHDGEATIPAEGERWRAMLLERRRGVGPTSRFPEV